MATFRDKEHKPRVMAPDFAGVPAELRSLPQWVMWRFEWVENGERSAWSKVPYSAKGSRKASSTDPETWGTFEQAMRTYSFGSYDGIGFVFAAGGGIVGVDFDNCIIEGEGEMSVSGEASHWEERLATYTEISPTGTGLHSYAFASVPAGRKDTRTGIEVYDSNRYFTVTGRSWHEKPLPLRQAQREVNSLWGALFVKERERPAPTPVLPTASVSELLDIAFRASNGARLRRLFEGDTSDNHGDASAADLALCDMLAFYSGGDSATLDAMFRASRLMRPKWDEKHYGDGRTYGEETINKALASCTEFYGSLKAIEEPAAPAEGVRRVNDYREGLEELYRTGYVPGVHPGWERVNDLYTVKPGQWTVVTGSPGSGKSTWLNALLVNLAVRHGWRFAVCSPEFWPTETHIAELMSLYTGKPFVPGPTRRMTREEAREAEAWVDEHFTFIEPVRAQLTMQYALKVAAEIHARRNIQGLVLDPWTEFEQDRERGETETEFVKRKLTDFVRFVRLNMIHGWIVAHPQKLQRNKSGEFPTPTLYDINGSAHWANKAHVGVSLHRPDMSDNRVELHVLKVKFRWCGKVGSTELYYDKVTGQFSEAPAFGSYEPEVDEPW